MQYKVKTLSVGGAYNKIFRSGDIVTDADFPAGNAERLCKDGSLVPYSPEQAVAEELANHGELPDVDLTPALSDAPQDNETPEEATATPATDEAAQEPATPVADTPTEEEYEEMDMKELKALATKNGIEYKGNISKKDLIAKLLG